MGDWTPPSIATIIGSVLLLIGTIISVVFGRGNLRFAAWLQQQAESARKAQEDQESARSQQIAADDAKEARLSKEMQIILDRYKADVADLRAEVVRQHAAHQAEIESLQVKYDALQVKYATLEAKYAALQAEHARVLTENQEMRARLAELERRQDGGTV